MQSLDPPRTNAQVIVKEIMDEPRLLARLNTPISEISALMADDDLRHVVVLNDDDQILDVVSQRDVIRHLVLTEKMRADGSGDGESQAQVRTLVKNDRPVTVSPDAPLVKAALLFASKNIGCLPVVDRQNRFVGMLTKAKVLSGLGASSGSRLDTEFTFFSSSTKRTTRPAFVRRGTGDIVVPAAYLTGTDDLPPAAALGYDADTKRILIKFVRESEAVDEAVSYKRSDENITFRADSFVKHFQLDQGASTYDVSELTDGRYLILSPRSLRV